MLNVRPAFASNDITDMSGGNVIFNSEVTVGITASGIFSSNSNNLIIGKLCLATKFSTMNAFVGFGDFIFSRCAMFMTNWICSIMCLIGIIVRNITSIEMFWIYTKPIMANDWHMEYERFVFGKDSTVNEKAYTVSKFITIKPKLSIAAACASNPKPTASCRGNLINLGPKASNIIISKFYHYSYYKIQDIQRQGIN